MTSTAMAGILFCAWTTACGGRADGVNNQRNDEDALNAANAGTAAPAAPTSSSVPGETLQPESTDPVFSYEEVAPGVTSVVQPSHFADPDDSSDPPVAITQVGDAGSLQAAEGSGDLTVLLVFDKSSSMLFEWDGVTRWQVANESLRSALDGILDVLTIGVIRFPLETHCGVPEFDSGLQIDFTSGRSFVETWQAMEHRLESFGTPLGAALDVADRAIAEARDEGRLEGRFRVLLVTDGEPNCGELLDTMTQRLASWYAMGVSTMVIGLPGSEQAEQTLGALAQAGGTGAVTMTATAAELGDVLYAGTR
jgi:hypothetical protein